MSGVSTPILQKQQNKLPTSMRYERVQCILQNDLAIKALLGPKNQSIDSRFGEKILFSKEVIEVTQAIHAEGKDAHKVPKNDILRMALRIIKGTPSNGEVRMLGTLAQAVIPPVSLPDPPEKKKQRPKPSPKTKPAAHAATVPERQGETPEPTEETTAVAKTPKAKKTAAKPAEKPVEPKTEIKASKPLKVTRNPRLSKPEPAKPVSITSSGAKPESTEENADEVPETELPPERQPLRLPLAFDPKKWPHYDVQSSAYSMLLSALTLVTHFEKFPGFEQRQKKLEDVVKDYLDTCKQIKTE